MARRIDRARHLYMSDVIIKDTNQAFRIERTRRAPTANNQTRYRGQTRETGREAHFIVEGSMVTSSAPGELRLKVLLKLVPHTAWLMASG